MSRHALDRGQTGLASLRVSTSRGKPPWSSNQLLEPNVLELIPKPKEIAAHAG